jgi:hypothetical protein
MGLAEESEQLSKFMETARQQRLKEETAFMKGLGAPDTTCTDEEVELGFWARFGGVLVCERGKKTWRYNTLRHYNAEFINALVGAKEKGDDRDHKGHRGQEDPDRSAPK